jgi:flavin reductase (DIM6/NTAB) family NADH-FMN oxidoreductase RutF
MMKELPLSKVYRLLEPGPVVMLTTAHKGRANVMTMSWHMMVEFEPPLVACVVSSADYSFAAISRAAHHGMLKTHFTVFPEYSIPGPDGIA